MIEEKNECSFCLENFKIDNNSIRPKCCNQEFHIKCMEYFIDYNLVNNKKNLCIICREPLKIKFIQKDILNYKNFSVDIFLLLTNIFIFYISIKMFIHILYSNFLPPLIIIYMYLISFFINVSFRQIVKVLLNLIEYICFNLDDYEYILID